MALVIVLLWSVLSFMLGMTLGLLLAPLFGFPAMEGGSAIFAILIAGPAGAIAGAVAAFKMLRRIPSVEKRQRLAVVTAAGIVGLVLIGWLASRIGGAG